MSTLNENQARELVAEAIGRIVPDAELEDLGDDTPLRAELELDSLDFLTFVETLSERSGVAISEDDYDRLVTMRTCIGFLTRTDRTDPRRRAALAVAASRDRPGAHSGTRSLALAPEPANTGAVPSTRDLLQRFRPAGAPGAATATGVPADRGEERAAELAGIFAAVEGAVADADRIRGVAVAEAQRRRERAREQAVASVAQARLDAEALRMQTVARARDALASSHAVNGDEAERRAREIEREAGRTREEDATAVVAAVRDLALDTREGDVAR